jgi:deoxycytidylate deaminase
MRQRIIAKCYDKKGSLISYGVNSYVKTHPLQAHWAKLVDQPHRIYLHAEIQAIIRARGKAIHKIRIERYNANGEQQDAYPCPVCQLAIKAAEIKLIEATSSTK